MIVADALPLSLSESPNFRSLIRIANPAIRDYSRDYVRSNVLEKRNELIQKYKAFFQGKNCIGNNRWMDIK